VRLTVDHKPELPEETSRIVDRGGFVRHNRVNGVLAVSRSAPALPLFFLNSTSAEGKWECSHGV
jgi:hypothetical protein